MFLIKNNFDKIICIQSVKKIMSARTCLGQKKETLLYKLLKHGITWECQRKKMYCSVTIVTTKERNN